MRPLVGRFDDIEDVRDVLHSRAADGLPIVVPDPGTEFGRRLLHTLGAQVTVEMTLDEYVELLDRAEGRLDSGQP